MRRSAYFLAASVVALSSLIAVKSRAQQTCEWDGERTICTPAPSGGGGGRPFPEPIYVPPDPAVERLAGELQTFDYAVGLFRQLGTSLPSNFLTRPASEAELSIRIDGILNAVWPEFASAEHEAELLRRHAAFYQQRNERQRALLEATKRRLHELPDIIRLNRQDLEVERTGVVDDHRAEVDLTRLALARLNDHASEQQAIATLLAFSPDPVVARSRLGPARLVTTVPYRSPEPSHESAGSAASAEPRELSGYSPLPFTIPVGSAPLGDKLSVLQGVGRRMWQDVEDLPDLRKQVAAEDADYASMLSEHHALQSQIQPLEEQAASSGAELSVLSQQTLLSIAKQQGAAETVVGSVIRDMALEALANRMIEHVYGIADVAGEARHLPGKTREAVLEFARHGGHVVLPRAGFEQQWEAFVEVQKQTLDVLDRAQGFMVEATHAAANGSPAELDALIKRVFGSVKWQEAEYVKEAGFSSVPEGPDRSVIEDFLDRYISKRREREGGAEGTWLN